MLDSVHTTGLEVKLSEIASTQIVSDSKKQHEVEDQDQINSLSTTKNESLKSFFSGVKNSSDTSTHLSKKFTPSQHASSQNNQISQLFSSRDSSAFFSHPAKAPSSQQSSFWNKESQNNSVEGQSTGVGSKNGLISNFMMKKPSDRQRVSKYS